MAIYNEIDIQVSASGDLVVGANKDFQMAEPSGCLQQDIAFRARTDKDDFEPHPDIGADLQSLIGEQNTRENAGIAERKLFDSLTKDGRIERQDLVVKGVPIAMNTVAVYTFVNASNYDVDIFTAAILDYREGISNTPGGGQ